MNLKPAILVLLVPACLLASPSSALRYRSAGRGRREEYELVASAHAGDIDPKRADNHFAVELRFMKRDAVIDECRRLGAWGDRTPRARDPVGCNIVYLDRVPMLCVIIAEEPHWVDDDRTTVLGHELYHCGRGAYHG